MAGRSNKSQLRIDRSPISLNNGCERNLAGLAYIELFAVVLELKPLLSSVRGLSLMHALKQHKST
jgi:hypothetical protein